MAMVQVPEGNGSGFIWDEEGHIVTNYHGTPPIHKPKTNTTSSELTFYFQNQKTLFIFTFARSRGFQRIKQIHQLDTACKSYKGCKFYLQAPKTNAYISCPGSVHPHNQFVPILQDLQVLGSGQVLVWVYTSHLSSISHQGQSLQYI